MKWGSELALLATLTPLLCHAQGFPGLDSVFGEDVAARVLTRDGQVSIYRNSTYWAIDTGDVVRVHQVVVTGADGHATFRVSDGSTFEIFPNSQVTFRANPGSLRDLLDVWLGRIRVHVQRPGGQPNPNRVFTPTAIISVRGTTFDVTVDDEEESTVVLVEEGSVAVEHRLMPRSGTPKILNAGQELTIHRNLPIDEARHFDSMRAVQMASDIFVQVMVRVPHFPGGAGPISGSGGLPGDHGAKPPPPPPPPHH
ncbi:MAG: FecR family protein [Bryobacteraceae bacterium]|jgi:hypothetical protein